MVDRDYAGGTISDKALFTYPEEVDSEPWQALGAGVGIAYGALIAVENIAVERACLGSRVGKDEPRRAEITAE